MGFQKFTATFDEAQGNVLSGRKVLIVGKMEDGDYLGHLINKDGTTQKSQIRVPVASEKL